MAESKIAIITGANSGIGFETALGIAKAGYKVILACRNQQKAEQSREFIIKHVPYADVDVMTVDLSSLKSVKTFAENYKSQFSYLNILINNAGVLSYSDQRTIDGFELQFATNYLSHFLLTALLLDIMPDSPESRVVSISSVTHKNSIIDFDDLQSDKKPKNIGYGQSKLACLMFGSELDRRLKSANKKIISVTSHPGGSHTGIFNPMPRVIYYLLKLIEPFVAHSHQEAAKTSLFAALSASVKGGDFIGPQGFMDLKGPPGLAKQTSYSQDPDIAKRLWEISESLINHRFMIT